MIAGETLWMRCRDGVRLASQLWRPPGHPPAPVLLMRQPYGSTIASTVTYAHPAWYAAQGFVVVVQDVRGRGQSEGEFGGFAQEALDGADAVRWARRLPEGNGRVGTYGFSYQGLTQLLSEPADEGEAIEPGAPDDPLPDCLAPACCGLDERLHWASEGGAHWWAIGLGWALQLAAQGCRRRGDAEGWRTIRRSLESGAFLRDGLALLERHDPQSMGLTWLGLAPRQPGGWRRHRVGGEVLRRPLLLIGGWHDPHLRGTLDLWRRSRRAGGQPWLRIGAWTHLDWHGGLDALQLAFFKAHLQAGPSHASGSAADAAQPPADRGGQGESGVPAGPLGLSPPDRGGAVQCQPPLEPLDPQDLRARVALQAGEGGAWHPPLAGGCPGWRLISSGLAAVRSDEGQLRMITPAAAAIRPGEPHRPPDSSCSPAADAMPLVLVHDPWRPVPGRGGHLGLDAGLAWREDLDRRADVACFSSAPLPEGLWLQGTPQLQLAVSADQPGFDLCAALSIVQEDGRVQQVSTGMARWLGEDCRRPWRRRLSLQPLLRRIPPGQRLRLSLAASAWPQIAVNAGDGQPPSGGVEAWHREVTLRFDLQHARLWLTPLFGAN